MYEDAHLDASYEDRYEDGQFRDDFDSDDYAEDDEDALLMECGHSVDCECDCDTVDYESKMDGDPEGDALDIAASALRDRTFYAQA